MQRRLQPRPGLKGRILRQRQVSGCREKTSTGASGIVYTGLFRGKNVAVKVLHEAESITTDQLRNFRAEVGVMRSLNHDNIVKFYGACLKRPHVCIIMEL